MNTITNNTEINLVSYCYEQIQEKIINGIFEPGKKLKIRELKDVLQTCHIPIREALSRLVSSGLVEAHDNKGFRVTKISEFDIHDIYNTFLNIELLALRQAIEKGNDSWKISIVAALYSLSLIENDKDASSLPYSVWSERNNEFHKALISGCNSPALMRIREELYLRFDRYCRMSFSVAQQKLHVNHEEHKKLADAVLNRDYSTAQALLTDHLLGSLADTITLFKKNNLF